MRYGIAEIMKMASEQPNHRTRVEFLRKHDHPALRQAFLLAYDTRLEWDLPRGWRPKYEPNKFLDQESTLYQSMRRMGKFLVDGYPGLSQERKMLLFVQLLESASPLDAELLVAMKDRRIPFRGLGRKVVREAFPGVLPEGEDD